MQTRKRKAESEKKKDKAKDEVDISSSQKKTEDIFKSYKKPREEKKCPTETEEKRLSSTREQLDVEYLKEVMERVIIQQGKIQASIETLVSTCLQARRDDYSEEEDEVF